jgi:hypothetical protein
MAVLVCARTKIPMIKSVVMVACGRKELGRFPGLCRNVTIYNLHVIYI